MANGLDGPATVDAFPAQREDIDYGDLLAREVPPLQPMIEQLLDEATGMILAGPPGVGKTWLMLSLARAVASGTPWLGSVSTTQAPVLIFDEEGNLPGMHARIKMLEAADPQPAALPIIFCIGHGVRLDRPDGMRHVATKVHHYRPGLTIFDSLTRIHGGDENSAGEMAEVFAVAKTLMRVYGTAILFIDHLRKKGLINEPEEMLRGSTEKRAWPESILFAAAGDQKNELTVAHIKSRYHQPLAPFRVALDVDELAGTAALSYAGGVVASSVTKTNEFITAVHELKRQLGDDGADTVTVAGWLECSVDTVRRHVARLVATGIVAKRTVRNGTGTGRPKEVFDIIGGQD